jgi:predicted phosphodiesterase
MRKFIAPILLCILLPCSAFTQSHTLLMSPYLQAVTTNSIYVLVESSSADTVAVEYGTTADYGSHAKTESIEETTEHTYVHNVKIPGLAPNTVYHYRAVLADTSSQDAEFRTAPQPGTAFRFAWMADCRSGVGIHDEISKRIKEANPAMSLYGGDLCISSSYSAFKDQFFRPDERALISRVPFFNTPGNHEKWTPNTQAFTQAPASTSGTQEYYSFDYGDLHVLVLNNEVDYSEGSPQYLYAQSDLSSATKPWKVVICHRPAYCAGGHGEDSKMITMSEKVFVPNHVDVVMNGHSHFFQHNLVGGIHHMVLGSAGAPLYDLSTALYVVKSAHDYSYGIIDVSPASFDMTVYNDKGKILDTLLLKK